MVFNATFNNISVISWRRKPLNGKWSTITIIAYPAFIVKQDVL
jgi:hypothetical protein